MTFVINVSAETLDKAASKTRYSADITFIGGEYNGFVMAIYIYIYICYIME